MVARSPTDGDGGRRGGAAGVPALLLVRSIMARPARQNRGECTDRYASFDETISAVGWGEVRVKSLPAGDGWPPPHHALPVSSQRPFQRAAGRWNGGSRNAGPGEGLALRE